MFSQIREVAVAWPQFLRYAKRDIGWFGVFLGVIGAPFLIPFVALMVWAIDEIIRDLGVSPNAP